MSKSMLPVVLICTGVWEHNLKGYLLLLLLFITVVVVVVVNHINHIYKPI